MERIFGLDLQLLQDVLLTAVAIFILFFALSYLLACHGLPGGAL